MLEYRCEENDKSVRTAVETFLHRYFWLRDVEGTLALVPDNVYSIGTGEGEVALDKQAMRRLLEQETALMSDPIAYEITAYSQRQRAPGVWDCFCALRLHLEAEEGTQAEYSIRLTLGMREQDGRILLDTLHASEPSHSQEEGEFFPIKFISEGSGQVNRKTQRELLEIIEQIMPGGIIGGYLEPGFPLYVANNSLLQMAGYGSYPEFEEDIGGLVINSIHPDDRDLVNREVEKALANGDQYEIEYRMLCRDKSSIWVHDIGRRTVALDGRQAIISVLTDISEQVHRTAHLKWEASSDPLTGIYNRKAAEEQIRHAMQACTSYLFVMFDLDNFKKVNDTYGHQQGDAVLNAFVRQMLHTFRRTDIVCRLGGDEFAVFIPDLYDVQAVKNKIESLISTYQRMMETDWPSARAALSAGGIYSQTPRSFAELYKLADDVLYEVKNEEKGRAKIREI